jgi:hypothetical protein
MICHTGDQMETRAAALLVLMSTLENSTQPNCYGMVDAQIAAIESGLLVNQLALNSNRTERGSAGSASQNGRGNEIDPALPR